MNFAGYVPLNRGLIEHTMTGRMTNNEALVFVWLVMLADRKTGSYTINQPTLRTFLPGLTKGGAQDALESLERKRYIYRDVKPRSQIAYRYWIQGFTPTDGPHKDFRLDLSEVFENRDPSRALWVQPAEYKTYNSEQRSVAPQTPPATPPQTPPATPPQTPKSNKKEKEKDIHKENPSGPMEGEKKRSIEGERGTDSQRECNGDSVVRDACAGGESTDELRLPSGYVLRDGDDGVGVYGPSGTKVHESVVSSLFSLKGIRA